MNPDARIDRAVTHIVLFVQMDEEIEIKQLRKEQVPRAIPMPDFSRPFMPKR
jgi:hypothetical protein